MLQVFAADRIYSLESPNEFFRAMIVENGRVARMIDKNEFNSQKEEFSDIMEFSGYVFPGFIDSHIHAISYGKFMEYVNLREVQSIEELVEKVAEKARKTPDGDWIYGVAWNQEKFRENRYPGKGDLDSYVL